MRVSTPAGDVQGFSRDGSIVFYGLPYAAAPVGSLRFAAPAPYPAWSGVRDATRPGPTAQRRGFPDPGIPEPSMPGDEVLNLNVFTPDVRGRRPVLVWFHGGAYIAGSHNSPWYDGAAFNRSDVVVVAVSYRLGVQGFAPIDDAPHNRGVRDWLAALAWVRDTIGTFGGDPDRVTIAGQSAGGGAVLTLLGVPGIEELAHRAIAASPVFAQLSPARGRALRRELSGLLGGRQPTDVTETELIDAQWQLRDTFGAAFGRAAAAGFADPTAVAADVLGSLGIAPYRDGELIREPVADAAVRSPLPLLIGATSAELTGAFPPDLPPVDGRLLGLPAAYGRQVRLGQVVTDLMFRAPAAGVAERRPDATWLYDFRWGSGAHCVDVPFAWSVPAVLPEALADDVHGAWVRFVHGEYPGWPAYRENRATRVFDAPSRTVSDGYASERTLLGLV